MSERDPLQDLSELARYGEERAVGLPADRIRRLGTRRRNRRHAVIGVAAVVVLLGGGAVFAQTQLRTDRPPIIATTPTAVPNTSTPSPPAVSPSTRTLTAANLLAVGDVPTVGAERVTPAAAGVGRARDDTSACIPDQGLGVFGAEQILTRNFLIEPVDPPFTPDPKDPLSGQPVVYTLALQFADENAATGAYETYTRWIADCDQTIQKRGGTPLGTVGKPRWHPVQTGTNGARGSWVETLYRLPGDTSDNGFFESVGLTVVDDRLMVTVALVYGQDNNVSTNQAGDPTTELPPHPQFGLVIAAARRLAR